MLIKQRATVEEDLWGSVDVEIRLSDTYSELFLTTGVTTQGLKLKRLQRTLAEDGLKVNSILELEYYQDEVSEVEAMTLNLLKNSCFILVLIDDEILFTGRVAKNYQKDILYINEKQVETYQFETKPVSQGFLGEITVGDVLETFTVDDWSSLIQDRAYAVGRFEGNEFLPVERLMFIRFGFGDWRWVNTQIQMKVANLMNLNEFLNMFCSKVASVVLSKFGVNVQVEIPTHELVGWFYPLLLKVSYENGMVENRSIPINAPKYKIDISSTNFDRSFYIDAGLFAGVDTMTSYKMQDTWTNDDYARWKAHKMWSKRNILDLKVDQFFHRLGANFGLITIITTVDDVNYQVKFLEPGVFASSPFRPVLVEKPSIRYLDEAEASDKGYEVHYSYIEDEAWNEFALKGFYMDGERLEAMKNLTDKMQGNLTKLFWGFFSNVRLYHRGRGNETFLPNTFLIFKREGLEWIERNSIVFNRMLWMKANKYIGEDYEPSYYWMPVAVWQVKDWEGGPWWKIFQVFRFYLIGRVNELLQTGKTKELNLTLPGFYKLKTEAGEVSWRFAEVGNFLVFDEDSWQIKNVEFDFSNWSIKLQCQV